MKIMSKKKMNTYILYIISAQEHAYLVIFQCIKFRALPNIISLGTITVLTELLYTRYTQLWYEEYKILSCSPFANKCVCVTADFKLETKDLVSSEYYNIYLYVICNRMLVCILC